jgi:hypothetical protein
MQEQGAADARHAALRSAEGLTLAESAADDRCLSGDGLADLRQLTMPSFSTKTESADYFGEKTHTITRFPAQVLDCVCIESDGQEGVSMAHGLPAFAMLSR